MPCTVKFNQKVYSISGAIDEFFDEVSIPVNITPIVLNLASVSSLNSQGMIKFKKMMDRFVSIPVEIHDCPAIFVDMINTFPGMLGNPNRPEMIKSLFVTYSCAGCGREYDRRLKMTGWKKFDIEGDPVCARCGNRLNPLFPLEENFIFYTDRPGP